MAFSSVPTITTGDVATASWGNTYIKNNFALTAPAVLTAQGDIVIASGANTPIRLAKDTNSTRSLTNTGGSNAPAWALVNLANGVSGILSQENGGLEFDASAVTTGDSIIGQSSGVMGLETAMTQGQAEAGTDTQVRGITAERIKQAIATLAAGDYVHVGSQQTEATTTSTSATDLLSVTSLTVAALSPCVFWVSARKTTGAASWAACGLKLNTTVVGEAAQNNKVFRSSNTNQAENGGGIFFLGPRLTNYTSMAARNSVTKVTASGMDVGNFLTPSELTDQGAAMITAEITSLIIRGILGSASITLGTDEVHVYELATS